MGICESMWSRVGAHVTVLKGFDGTECCIPAVCRVRSGRIRVVGAAEQLSSSRN